MFYLWAFGAVLMGFGSAFGWDVGWGAVAAVALLMPLRPAATSDEFLAELVKIRMELERLNDRRG